VAFTAADVYNYITQEVIVRLKTHTDLVDWRDSETPAVGIGDRYYSSAMLETDFYPCLGVDQTDDDIVYKSFNAGLVKIEVPMEIYGFVQIYGTLARQDIRSLLVELEKACRIEEAGKWGGLFTQVHTKVGQLSPPITIKKKPLYACRIQFTGLYKRRMDLD